MNINEFEVYRHDGGALATARALAAGGRRLAPWTLKAERGGNPILPDEVYHVLQEECAKFPGPVERDEVFAIVLERTACRTKDFEMGLSRKSGGRHVTHPDPRIGDVAEDILQHRSSGHHWDVFGGAALGRPLNAGQGPSIGVIDMGARPWVGPVCADVVDPRPDPTPVPPGPPVPPVPPAPPSIDQTVVVALSRIDSRLALIVDQITDRVVSKVTEELHQQIGVTLIGVHVLDILGRLDRNLGAIGQGGGGAKCNFPRLRSAEAAQLRRTLGTGDPKVEKKR